MDPNESLRIIECADLRSEEKDAATALNSWLSKGGFQPDWAKYPDGTKYYLEHCAALDMDPYIHKPPRHPSVTQISPDYSHSPSTPVATYAVHHRASANDTQVGGTHYKNKPIEPWDYIARNGIGYLEGNAIKYLSRWKEKNGIEDLRKAAHYVQKLIELEEERLVQQGK